MRIDLYISSNRIIDLSSKDLNSAYEELLYLRYPASHPAKRKKILKELVEREHSMTSYIGEGVALPHARVDMKRPYALAIGRCPAGLAFEGKDSYEDIRFVFLLLASKKAKNYLSFLAFWLEPFKTSRSWINFGWLVKKPNSKSSPKSICWYGRSTRSKKN